MGLLDAIEGLPVVQAACKAARKAGRVEPSDYSVLYRIYASLVPSLGVDQLVPDGKVGEGCRGAGCAQC